MVMERFGQVSRLRLLFRLAVPDGIPAVSDQYGALADGLVRHGLVAMLR